MLDIETALSEPETLDRTPVNEMFRDDLVHIFDMNEAVPDRLGIDHHHRSMLALVKAAGLIRPNLGLQPGSFNSIFKGGFELFTASRKTAWTGRILVPLVGAYKDMVFKCRHL
jgi:hypothetical protein